MSHEFSQLIQAIVCGESSAVSRAIDGDPALAVQASAAGAGRDNAASFFFPEIGHYLYAGDTPLHIAAAAFQPEITGLLLEHGANCRARNRRGAEPAHYAADTNHWSPVAQAATLVRLLEAGADPNARDRSGVAPLHRAVRTRSAAAVRALLAHGADPQQPNGGGSTPLLLALQTTGRGGSGADRAKAQQFEIVHVLLEHGARAEDLDRKHRAALQALLAEGSSPPANSD
jgi:ankyrin repeat protein